MKYKIQTVCDKTSRITMHITDQEDFGVPSYSWVDGEFQLHCFRTTGKWYSSARIYLTGIPTEPSTQNYVRPDFYEVTKAIDFMIFQGIFPGLQEGAVREFDVLLLGNDYMGYPVFFKVANR